MDNCDYESAKKLKKFPCFFVGLQEEGLARTQDGRVTCLKCFQTFSNMSNGERHYRSRHLTLAKVQCKFCQRTFKNIYSHNEHLRQSHGLSQTMLKSRVVPKIQQISKFDEDQWVLEKIMLDVWLEFLQTKESHLKKKCEICFEMEGPFGQMTVTFLKCFLISRSMSNREDHNFHLNQSAI